MSHAFTNVLDFLIEFIFSIFVYAVLLRFFLQWVKADFYNPFCQMIIHVTNPLLRPLRRIIPGFFAVDMAALVLAYIVILLQLTLVAWLVSVTITSDWYIILLTALIKLILAGINLYIWLIIIRAITSWFAQARYHPAIIALQQLTEPLLNKIRRTIPVTKSGFDFSPIVALLVLFCLQVFITSIAM